MIAWMSKVGPWEKFSGQLLFVLQTKIAARRLVARLGRSHLLAHHTAKAFVRLSPLNKVSRVMHNVSRDVPSNLVPSQLIYLPPFLPFLRRPSPKPREFFFSNLSKTAFCAARINAGIASRILSPMAVTGSHLSYQAFCYQCPMKRTMACHFEYI